MPEHGPRRPAVEGWFTMDPTEARLLGSRCTKCRTVFFPKVEGYCRNPACDSTELEETPLSRTGRLWSYTDARYRPPPPYVAAEPYEPFTIGAVELDEEKIVVLGQMVPGVEAANLRVGDEVELVLGALYEDSEGEHMTWQWRPLAARA